MASSPIEIIGQHLVNVGLGHWADTPHPSQLPNPTPAQATAWAVWLSTLPYVTQGQCQAIGLFGPDGRLQGRFMKTGKAVRYPGLQVRTQAKDYSEAYQKLNDIFVELTENVRRTVVQHNAVDWMLHNVSPQTDIIEMGTDQQTDLQNFSANFLVRVTVAP